jgi:hypothetical protein
VTATTVPRIGRRSLILALLLVLLTAGLISVGAKSARAGDGSAQLSLPWATGQSWTLLSGIHSWSGYSSPTSSLDFTTANGQVRAGV